MTMTRMKQRHEMDKMCMFHSQGELCDVSRHAMATRSIELRFALIRDHIKNGAIGLRKIATSLNSSDLNAKSLRERSFIRLRNQWMTTVEKAMGTPK